MPEINWIAVLAAAVVAFVIGAVWYSPLLFAKPWMSALGKRPEEMGRPGPAIANAAVMNFISAATLAWLFRWIGITSLSDGILAALTVAAGLVVANQIMRDRFHGLNFTVSLINGTNTLVVYMAMGAVLVLVGG